MEDGVIQLTCCVLFVFGGSVVGYFNGLAKYRLKKIIEYTPTSKAISVAPGIAEISGKAQVYKKEFNSPFKNSKCIYYRTLIYKWHGSGKHRSRSLATTLESHEPFYISDETGNILVSPFAAKGSGSGGLGTDSGMSSNQIKCDFTCSGMPGGGLLSGLFGGKNKTDVVLSSFLAKNYPALKDYQDNVDIEETFIEPGDQLYMLGKASEYEEDGKVQMIVRPDKEKGIFCLADGTEKNALGDVALMAYASLAFAPPIAAVCLSYMFGIASLLNIFSGLLVFFLLFLAYAGAIWIMLLEFYNGMIVLKNNVDRAHANLDALLMRRQDLFENLVKLVLAASKHEKSVQLSIAKLRAMPDADSKTLLAIAENYPKLMVADNYKSLSKELISTEDWIAGSRQYIRDSIELFNTKISSFPYFLYAPLAGLVPLKYESK